jgi:hypothetical protein
MILFDHVVQVFAWPEQTGFRERPLLLQDLEGGRICRVLIHGNHVRWNRIVRLLQFRGIGLDPTKDRGVIDGHTAVVQQFFDMPIAQDIAEIPADGAQDDVSFNVAPLEQ